MNAIRLICLMLVTVSIVSDAADPARAATLVFEAESGALGSDYTVTNDGGIQYIAIQTDYADLNSPASSNRVATYNLTFPAAGTYNLYARVRVGPDGDKDDSFFYGNGFGLMSIGNSNDWNTVNNLIQGGYANPGELVTDSGSAGIGVWKWLNLSRFTNFVTDPPITFTVTASNLVQTFQIGARENGLDVDKFIFSTTNNTFTVAQLDSIGAGNPPPESLPRDLVNGNLIQFSDNGAWSWYQDERAVVDIGGGKLVVGYVECGSGSGGTNREGNVCATIFDLAHGTGLKTTLRSAFLSYGTADDHNAPAFVVRPDGKYLAIYAGHNSDNHSYWRIYDPGAGAWNAEQTFDWAAQPGGTDFPTTYSNPYYLSAEGRIYNFSRGNGHGGQNLMLSTDLGDSWTFAGLMTTNGNVGYVNGYFRYKGNGADRIDFICTEYHPRDFNTSIYHGYVSNAMAFRTDGTVEDTNLFDKVAVTPQSFTPVFLANTIMPPGQTNFRCWNDDVQRYADGTIAAIISTRVNNNVNGGDGGINPDHSFFYCRYNGSNWTSTYLCRAGVKLWSDEADYVGLGCLNPDDPATIYVSTTYDPRDNTNFLGVHEIFRGVTTNHGASFDWTPITQNSVRDNLRPIVPSWDRNHTALIWWRGTYSSQQAFDSAVVGIIDRHSETSGLMTYLDADASNTFFASTGAPLTTGAGSGQWHQQMTAGNGGSILSSADSIGEDAPLLITQVTAPDPGTHDVWVNFWGKPGADWRIMAGLSTNQMQLFRQIACKEVEPFHHTAALVLSNNNGAFLYQAYLGRVTNSTFAVFVDDNAVPAGATGTLAGDTARTWYDGVSYAQVSTLNITSVTHDLSGSSLTLAWNSIPPEESLSTLTYSVQKKSPLSDTTWTTIGSGLLSAGGTTTFTDTSTGDGAAFYRITSP